MPPNRSGDAEFRTLRNPLDDIEGIETVFARPGAPEERRFQGYVSMRADGHEAVRRLLTKLGRTFSTVFHVGEQKCEMGFRVPDTISIGSSRESRPGSVLVRSTTLEVA